MIGSWSGQLIGSGSDEKCSDPTGSGSATLAAGFSTCYSMYWSYSHQWSSLFPSRSLLWQRSFQIFWLKFVCTRRHVTECLNLSGPVFTSLLWHGCPPPPHHPNHPPPPNHSHPLGHSEQRKSDTSYNWLYYVESVTNQELFSPVILPLHSCNSAPGRYRTVG